MALADGGPEDFLGRQPGLLCRGTCATLLEGCPEAGVKEGRRRLGVADVEVAGLRALGKEAGEGGRNSPVGAETGRDGARRAGRGDDSHEVGQGLGTVLAFERSLDLRQEPGGTPFTESLEERVAALEVEIEGALGDARPGRDLLHGGASDAALPEDLLGGGEDLGAAIGSSHVTDGQCSLAGLMTTGSRALRTIPGHPSDTMAWVRPDLLQRLLPFAALTLFVGLVWHPRWLGLGTGEAPAQLLFGVLAGVLMFLLAMPLQLLLSRRRGALRIPDGPDAALQGGYYVLNAAAEEGFFRGLLQGGLGVVLGMPAGFLLATAAYVLYHRLGNWAWADVAATALAGVPLGLAFWLLPGPPSLLGVTLAHVGATCGFLGPGPYLLRRLRLV